MGNLPDLLDRELIPITCEHTENTCTNQTSKARMELLDYNTMINTLPWGMSLLVSEPMKGYFLFLAAWILNNYKIRAKNKWPTAKKYIYIYPQGIAKVWQERASLPNKSSCKGQPVRPAITRFLCCELVETVCRYWAAYWVSLEILPINDVPGIWQVCYQLNGDQNLKQINVRVISSEQLLLKWRQLRKLTLMKTLTKRKTAPMPLP